MLPRPNITAVDALSIRPFDSRDVAFVRSAAHRIGKNVLGTTYSTWHESFEGVENRAWTATISDTPAGFAAIEEYGEGIFILHSDIVVPDHQRKGIGTALVLVRLATLDEQFASAVGLLSTAKSITFYERFGFEPDSDPVEDSALGVTLTRMVLPFSTELRHSALENLESAGLTVDLPALD